MVATGKTVAGKRGEGACALTLVMLVALVVEAVCGVGGLGVTKLGSEVCCFGGCRSAGFRCAGGPTTEANEAAAEPTTCALGWTGGIISIGIDCGVLVATTVCALAAAVTSGSDATSWG